MVTIAYLLLQNTQLGIREATGSFPAEFISAIRTTPNEQKSWRSTDAKVAYLCIATWLMRLVPHDLLTSHAITLIRNWLQESSTLFALGHRFPSILPHIPPEEMLYTILGYLEPSLQASSDWFLSFVKPCEKRILTLITKLRSPDDYPNESKSLKLSLEKHRTHIDLRTLAWDASTSGSFEADFDTHTMLSDIRRQQLEDGEGVETGSESDNDSEEYLFNASSKILALARSSRSRPSQAAPNITTVPSPASSALTPQAEERSPPVNSSVPVATLSNPSTPSRPSSSTPTPQGNATDRSSPRRTPFRDSAPSANGVSSPRKLDVLLASSPKASSPTKDRVLLRSRTQSAASSEEEEGESMGRSARSRTTTSSSEGREAGDENQPLHL
ncbi:hypothetical protein DFH09DRAFT_1402289 [Mycena vulgaris]|nr:hypothetical protein DFH09DRAFT_1402289 [Mycena vulgaris]